MSPPPPPPLPPLPSYNTMQKFNSTTISDNNLSTFTLSAPKKKANFNTSNDIMIDTKVGSKSNNDVVKCSTIRTENTNMPNKILSNDTDIKIPEISTPPTPPPLLPSLPPILLPYYTMHKFNSSIDDNNNLNTSTLSTPPKKAQSNTSASIKIDTPTQIKICAKAGIPTIIEISVPVDTEIEIKTNPIQSMNEDITSDNCYTNSSGSDSGYDALSGSTSDVSCCGKIW